MVVFKHKIRMLTNTQARFAECTSAISIAVCVCRPSWVSVWECYRNYRTALREKVKKNTVSLYYSSTWLGESAQGHIRQGD